jgi:hypothetical protein
LTILAALSGGAAFLVANGCSKDGGQKAASKTTAPPAEAVKPAAPAAPEAAKAPEAAAAPVPDGKAHAEGEGYVVDVKPPASAAPGAEAVVEVTVTATGQFHLNKDFPTVLDVVAPSGVDVGKPKLTAADAAKFEEKTATFQVKFTAKDAGDKKFGANFHFAVCTATTCNPKKEALGWTVAVK